MNLLFLCVHVQEKVKMIHKSIHLLNIKNNFNAGYKHILGELIQKYG